MSFNGTLETPTDEFTRNYTIAIFCKVLHETAYNESATQMDLAKNVTYTKTTASGDSETVEGIPENIFTDYEAEDIQAATIAENGTVLDTCTVSGEGEIEYSE